MLELEHGFRVVDVHATLDPDAEAVESRGRDITPERLEREMHQAGVVRAAVSPTRRPAGEGYLRANNAVARLSVERPFLAFARVDGPRHPASALGADLRNRWASPGPQQATPEDIEQYAYDDRFHGFVCAPLVDGLPTEAVLDELDEVAMPVLVHGGEQYPPDAVADDLLADHSFPVILSGFGGTPQRRDLMGRALGLLDTYDQLYLDTCFVRYRDVLEQGLLEHPDRILFGSGTPTIHPNVGVMEVLTLDVSEDAMRRAFSKNPSRVIPGLKPGGE